MKPTFSLILFILFLSTIIQCQVCEGCVELSFYSCTVCYNNCTNVSLPFKNCAWTFCAEYYTSSDNSTSCSHYQTKNLPQNECFGKCCAQEIDHFTVDQLNSCEAKSKQNIKIMAIVGGVIGGVFILIFIICCVCTGMCSNVRDCIGNLCGSVCEFFRDLCQLIGDCLRYICTCRCFRREVPYSEPAQLTVQVEMVSRTNFYWQEEDTQNHQKLNNEDQNCAICLNNRGNIMTGCGHIYHSECIQAWHARNQHCPLCKSQNISNIKFFCRGCLKWCIKFNLKVDKNITQTVLQMKGPNCPTCQ